jgi:hypothetical protein
MIADLEGQGETKPQQIAKAVNHGEDENAKNPMNLTPRGAWFRGQAAISDGTALRRYF